MFNWSEKQEIDAKERENERSRLREWTHNRNGIEKRLAQFIVNYAIEVGIRRGCLAVQENRRCVDKWFSSVTIAWECGFGVTYFRLIADKTIYSSSFRVFGREETTLISNEEINETAIIIEQFIKTFIPGLAPRTCCECEARFPLREGRCKDHHLSHVPSHGFVYIFGNQEHGIYKIGCSKSPERRLKAFPVGKYPFPVEIVWKRQYEDMYKAEEGIHKRFGSFRTHNEWFRIPDLFDQIKKMEEGAESCS